MNTLEQLEKFTPTRLIEVYGWLYQNQYGERKLLEVIEKVNTSPRIANYIKFIVTNNQIPDIHDFHNLMNDVRYFLFSKSETLCLGALCTIEKWSGYVERSLPAFQIRNIVIQTIFRGETQRFGIGNDFYGKFFHLIDDIANERFDINKALYS